MRLIDADKIYFRCAYNGTCMASHEQCLKCSDYVIDAEGIQEQPTAYDVGKVTYKLEEFADLAAKRWREKTSPHAFQEYNCWVKAIEIVKDGREE